MSDSLSYAAVFALVFTVMTLGLAVVYTLRKGERSVAETVQPQRQDPAAPAQRQARPVNRVQAGVRRRQRAAAAAAAAAAQEQQQQQEDGSESGSDSEEEEQQRPQAQIPQLPKTARSAYEERRRKKDADREAAEAAQEAEIARAAAARYAQQEAEAAEWMGQISVEEQGQEADEQQQGEDLLSAFVEYIKERKTVALEDLAAEFGLRVQDVITRVQELDKSGRISGVMDDRGKFIYISKEEMAAVADFIKRRGRVAISELAAKSNTFIDLEARASTAPVEGLQELNLDE